MATTTNQNQYSNNCSIHILNDDILMRVFDYLHFDDKIRLRRTCSRWKVLLDKQVSRVKSLRMGQFNQGGYNITSGLTLQCSSHHNNSNHRQYTGTLFNEQVFGLHPDLETLCYSINQYDYLHRALKHCYNSITMLSLGRLKISYRLLIVITHNLPNLEHLEIIGCASDFPSYKKRKMSPLMGLLCISEPYSNSNSNNNNNIETIPSIESFNSHLFDEEIYSTILYNQHHDESVNMEKRLTRSAMVKNCGLVKESKSNQYWPNLKHLLIKECNLLNEFSLSIILAITNQTLEQLAIESNQYLTGEFLNYCGPKLQILKVKHCPLFQVKFLEDLVKLRQLLSSSSETKISQQQQQQPVQKYLNEQPQPIDTSMLRNYRNCNQSIYCTL